MSVTVKEITYDELIDRIREQSARIHETNSDERRLLDPAWILMDIRECADANHTRSNLRRSSTGLKP